MKQPIKNLILLLAAALVPLAARAQSTAFTYQGRLEDGGSPASGNYDLRLALFNAVTAGTQQGGLLTNAPTAVSNGLFTVTLDFGNQFPGADRWLELAVRTNGGGAFSTLAPRQAITATPYAVRAATAATATSVSGSVSASQLTGTISSNNIGAGSITTTMLATGSVTSNQLAAGSVNTASLADGAVTAGKVFSVTQTVGVVTFRSPAPTAGGNFGNSVAAVGNSQVLIGAPLDDSAAGAAYLFFTDGRLINTLRSPTLVADDQFGWAVAVGGAGNSPRLIVGAYLNDTGANNAGAAYVYNTLGTFLNTITNPAPALNAHFGYALAAVGTDRVLIGTPGDSAGESHAGAAYLYNLNGTLLNTFTNPTPVADDNFGSSVAAVGADRVLIGAPGDNTGAGDSGAAYLFSTNGTLITTFTNPTPASDDVFGSSVAALGTDRVLIGAPSHDIGPVFGGTPNAGAAYLFRTNGTLLTTFNNPSPASGDLFGTSVAALGSDQVLIGENDFFSSSARLYRTNGSLIAAFTEPASGKSDSFGYSVAAVGNHVLVGTPNGTGEAYLFTRDGVAPGLFAEGVGQGAITSVNLADGAVGSLQIADGAVGSAQILDGSITSENLSSSIGVWSASGTEVFRSQGKVGIGTSSSFTTPLRLTVAGSGIYNSGTAAAMLLNNTAVNGHDWEWHALDDGGMQVVDFTAVQTRLLIDTNGSVGLGETSPGARLDVRTALARVAIFNRTGDDGVLVNWQRDGINVGSVTVAAGVVSYTAFTGSHYAWTEAAIGRGMLVAMTGDNRRAAGGDTAEIIYGVTPTQTANDPRCLGAYLGLEEPSHPASDQNPHQIMSVGNGEMWVTASGGNLEPGDALITSALPGCAMKDDPAQFPIGHIIARAAERVDWATVPPDPHGVKRTKISVLFTNYERHTGGTALAALRGLDQKVEEQRAENAELKQRLEKLERLMNRNPK